jgi:hypothetical protein
MDHWLRKAMRFSLVMLFTIALQRFMRDIWMTGKYGTTFTCNCITYKYIKDQCHDLFKDPFPILRGFARTV